MAKSADYFISAVRFSGHKISAVKAHQVNDENVFGPGTTMTFTKVASLILQGTVFKTITPADNGWNIGQEVDVFIRTHKDKKHNNNLDELTTF